MNQPVQQSSDLPDAIEVATSVFSAIYFNGGAWPDESLDDQMRRAMRAALISIGFPLAATQVVADQPTDAEVSGYMCPNCVTPWKHCDSHPSLQLHRRSE